MKALLYSEFGAVHLGNVELVNLELSRQQMKERLGTSIEELTTTFDLMSKGIAHVVGTFKLTFASPEFIAMWHELALKQRRHERHVARFQRIGSQQKKRGRR